MNALAALVSTRIATDLAVLVLLKASLVLVLTALLVELLRRHSAALRHQVWVVGIAALLVLPVVEIAAPDWSPVRVAYPEETSLLGLEALETAPRADIGLVVEESESGTPAPGGSLPVASLLLIVWWIGVLTLAIDTVARLVRAAFFRRHARRVAPEHPLSRLLDMERRKLGIFRRVELLLVDEPGLAATVGGRPAAVILGSDVAEMPERDLRSILVHELAHVRRGDFLTSLVTSLATVVYWPNPLFWWARRRCELEREQACDDEVLNRGIRSPDYARVLLDFATRRPVLRPALRSTLGLRFSATKRRLLAVLDEDRDRRPGGAIASASIVGLFALVLWPVGALDLVASAPGTGSTGELVEALANARPEVRARAARTLGRRDPSVARVELERLLDDAESDVRLAAMGALEQLSDPASLPAMARVLERPFDDGRGEHGFVLKLAILAVGNMDSPQAVDLLAEQLGRPVAQLRWLALETMLSMPRHGRAAVPFLVEFAASDPSERNRELARAALTGLDVRPAG